VERNVRLLAIGVAIRTFGAAMYNPFLALFLYSVLQISYLEIGIIFAAIGAVQLPFGLAGGLWADRVGRRRLIVLSLATEAVTTAVLAYSFDIRSLGLAIGAALVGGTVLTATGAAFSAYIADFSTGSERTRSFTWYRITFNVGFAAGTSLGGILVQFVGFVGALAIAATVIASATVFVLAQIRPSPYDEELRQQAVVRAGNGPQPPPSGRSLRESLSLMVHDRRALIVAAGFALAYVTIAQWQVTFPLFVHNKLGISYAFLGIGLALNGVIVVVGQAPTTEGLIGRRHTSIAIGGVLLYTIAFLLLGVAALWLLAPLILFFVAVLVLTVGENVSSIPASTLPSNLAPDGEVGAYNGAFNTVFSAAGIAGLFLGGAVLSFVPNPLLEWVLLCLPILPAVIILRYASARLPIEKDRA
jgi:MFS family permease